MNFFKFGYHRRWNLVLIGVVAGLSMYPALNEIMQWVVGNQPDMDVYKILLFGAVWWIIVSFGYRKQDEVYRDF